MAAPPLIRRLRGSAFAFPLAAGVALAMLVISELSYRDASASIARVADRDQARIDVQTLRRTIYEAQSGQRGYLLTGRKEALESYTAAVPAAREALASLHRFYDQHGSAEPLLRDLDRAIDEQFGVLRESIALYDAGKTESWQSLLLSNIGEEKADAARALTDLLLAVEGQRIEIGRIGILQTLMLNRIGVAAMTAVSLLALFMYLRQTALLERQTADEAGRIVDERNRLESEVQARTAQLKELAQHLQSIREDERSHLARELHDELGALLTAAKLDAARLKSRLASATPEVMERLAHLNEQLNSGIALKRRIIEDLRPSSLSNLGLVAALEILLREWSQRTEVEVEGDLQTTRPLMPRTELTAYRLVQEALTNVAKYARATHVHVRLADTDDGRVLVEVTDDGVGFDVHQPNAQSTHGLIGMRYRVEALGGTLAVESTQGDGTSIRALLPVSTDATAGEGHDPYLAIDAPKLVAAV